MVLIIRITKICDVNFFLTPAPYAQLYDVSVNISLPVGCEKDGSEQPALIYWDKGLFERII